MMEVIMKRKRILSIFLVLAMCIGLVSGCVKSNQTNQIAEPTMETTTGEKADNISENGKDKIDILCTTFPQYDWVKQLIAGEEDKYELTLLLDTGVDLHNYQPTVSDMVKIIDCDMFIYVGGESDRWVEDALKEVTNKDMKVINLMETLGENIKEEELVEGMEEDRHHDHDHDDDHDDDHSHEHEEAEYDEHVWLSLKNAQTMVDAILTSLLEIDDENAEKYSNNAKNYISELRKLDEEYEAMVLSAQRKTILFGDRFPFRYLVDDYNLDYYAAFSGCSAETEASFETIAFLSEKVEELELPVVLVIESSNQKIAESIINNTESKEQEILILNSLQSVTSAYIEDGISYLSIMKENLEILKQALN